ncbi:MAG: radical SAM family heme chaperone HemW [Polyangiaceae bacterium]
MVANRVNRTQNLDNARKRAGVYVHFPWCLAKCPYCDFVSYAAPREEILHEKYADAVLRELAARTHVLDGFTIDSVFFGGGTPSLWEPTALGRVLSTIRSTLDCAQDLEVTVECNPTSLDGKRAETLVGQTVNRFSIGVQGLDEKRLKFLGRKHDPAGAMTALREALDVAARHEGVRVSGDLIFGVADEAPDESRAEACTLADLGLTHLSCYELTIEPGTQFGELAKRGRLPLADDGRTTEAFLAIDDALASRGFRHYEISNYAKPGNESRHNLGYWQGHPYLGLGTGAYGTAPGKDGGPSVRYRNVVDPLKYMQNTIVVRTDVVGEGDGLSISSEPLDGETLLRERIMLGLRLESGFDLAQAAGELGVEAWPKERAREAEKLIEKGRLEKQGERLRIPKPFWIYANDTAARLF